MTRHNGYAGERGSLLIVTLWIITILSAVAVALGHAFSTEVRLMKYRLAHEQAMTLARSGVYLALQRLAHDPTPDVDWLGDSWAAPQPEAPVDQDVWVVVVPGANPATGDAVVRVTITDENRRLNLNTADENQIDSLFGNVPKVMQAIVDYRDLDDPEDSSEDGPEPYYAKDAAFQQPEEVWTIPAVSDLPAELAQTLKDETTVYGSGTVNLNTASEAVLVAMKYAAYPDLRQHISTLVQGRAGSDRQFDMLNDCQWTGDINDGFKSCVGLGGLSIPDWTNLTSGFASRSDVFWVDVVARVGTPEVVHRVHAIVKKEDNKVPSGSQIISWRES